MSWQPSYIKGNTYADDQHHIQENGDWSGADLNLIFWMFILIFCFNLVFFFTLYFVISHMTFRFHHLLTEAITTQNSNTEAEETSAADQNEKGLCFCTMSSICWVVHATWCFLLVIDEFQNFVLQMGMKEDNNEVTLKTRILSLELLQVIIGSFVILCACFYG